MRIKEISPEQTIPLRNEVLRPGRPHPECVFDGDDLKSTVHFGAMNEAGDIVGVVSVYRRTHPLLNAERCYQLRAMATHASCRGRGIGNLLLTAAEEYARMSGASFIWANARSAATPFYIKSGYEILSDEFMIDGIGLHYLVGKPV